MSMSFRCGLTSEVSSRECGKPMVGCRRIARPSSWGEVPWLRLPTSHLRPEVIDVDAECRGNSFLQFNPWLINPPLDRAEHRRAGTGLNRYGPLRQLPALLK